MLVRSYSRHSRVIWCEATTETSGQSSRTRASTACSWLGSAYEWSRQIAIASTPSARKSSRIAGREPGEIERLALAAVMRETARHLAAEVARHERRRLLVVEVEVVGTVAARDLERVAEALVVISPVLTPLRSVIALITSGRAVREEADVLDRDRRSSPARRARRARSPAASCRPSPSGSPGAPVSGSVEK